MNTIIHNAHLFYMRHQNTLHMSFRQLLIYGALLLALVVGFIAVDIVSNQDEYASEAQKQATECFAVLNGEMTMTDKDESKIARVVWEKIELVGGVK